MAENKKRRCRGGRTAVLSERGQIREGNCPLNLLSFAVTSIAVVESEYTDVINNDYEQFRKTDMRKMHGFLDVTEAICH